MSIRCANCESRLPESEAVKTDKGLICLSCDSTP